VCWAAACRRSFAPGSLVHCCVLGIRAHALQFDSGSCLFARCAFRVQSCAWAGFFCSAWGPEVRFEFARRPWRAALPGCSARGFPCIASNPWASGTASSFEGRLFVHRHVERWRCPHSHPCGVESPGPWWSQRASFALRPRERWRRLRLPLFRR
jgi:hypothetical protein